MPRSLPPLTSLRAFEAAARLQSFAKAARELHVTPAAISHQIRGLEQYLGVTLFHRTARRPRLTEQGARAAEQLSEGFDRLVRGVDLLREGADRGQLTVGTTPSFATRWLVPRIGRFVRRCPEVELRLEAATALLDLDRDEVDVAIRFGGGFDGMQAIALFDEALVPLASPSFARLHRLRRPGDLARVALLHDDSMRRAGRRTGWADWFRAAGASRIGVDGGLHFDDGHLVLQAAALGRGVALGRLAYAVDDLAGRRLKVLFPPALRMDLRYHLLAPQARAGEPAIKAFTRWLTSEAAAFGRRIDETLAEIEARGHRSRGGGSNRGRRR